MVMSVDHPGLTFNLTSVRSEPTYNQPVQQWTFTSDFAVIIGGSDPGRSRFHVFSAAAGIYDSSASACR